MVRAHYSEAEDEGSILTCFSGQCKFNIKNNEVWSVPQGVYSSSPKSDECWTVHSSSEEIKVVTVHTPFLRDETTISNFFLYDPVRVC